MQTLDKHPVLTTASIQALIVAGINLAVSFGWVTISSEAPFTRSGRSLAGIVRTFASGTILMTLPVGTATKPCTCRIDRKAW